MTARFLTGAGMALLFASLGLAQAGPEGHWEGTLSMGNRDIGLSLDLAKNAKSEWIGSMGMPAEKMTGLVVMNIAVSGKSVKFTAVELMMAKVDLTLDENQSMKGTVTTQKDELPIEFKRTGPAKVDLVPPSPAVSKELEGDWEGTLQTPGRGMLVILHFKNQPDHSVAATIDTPDTGGAGLPLNDVKQTGQKVEFGLKIAHGKFEGTLNSAGTEIAGQLTHEETGMPLVLHKK